MILYLYHVNAFCVAELSWCPFYILQLIPWALVQSLRVRSDKVSLITFTLLLYFWYNRLYLSIFCSFGFLDLHVIKASSLRWGRDDFKLQVGGGKCCQGNPCLCQCWDNLRVQPGDFLIGSPFSSTCLSPFCAWGEVQYIFLWLKSHIRVVTMLAYLSGSHISCLWCS